MTPKAKSCKPLSPKVTEFMLHMVEGATDVACEGNFTEVLIEDDEKNPSNFFLSESTSESY